MAHLWVPDDKTGDWHVAELDGDLFQLSPRGPEALGDSDSDDPAWRPALLINRGNGQENEWVLLAGDATKVRLNGSPLWLAMRVLSERDEIVVSDPASTDWQRFFFSNERLARIEPFPATQDPVPCARCKMPILHGQPAVLCPACRLWHHDADDRHCWTYMEHCAGCDYQTELNGRYRWTPEAL